MKEIAPEGRIKDKDKLVEFLTKTYQKPIAEIITNFLFKYCFSDYAVSINIDDFFKNIQNFVNRSDNHQWVKFRFQIYDVFNEGKVTERGLFEFLKYASLKPLHLPDKPTTTLKINESIPDIFLDIFANDFYKIIRAFAVKRAANKQKEEQSKFMNFNYQTEMRTKPLAKSNFKRAFKANQYVENKANLTPSAGSMLAMDHTEESYSSQKTGWRDKRVAKDNSIYSVGSSEGSQLK